MANSRICKIEGCGKGGKIRRGWCQAHYALWRKHGDPLKKARKKTQAFFEDVVLAYDGAECLTWPYSKSESGYGVIYVARGRAKVVSRLACEAVHGPPPSPKHHAAHSCGKGHLACVAKGHLSWKTPLENAADMVAHGTSPRGERCGKAKITEGDARAILALKGQAKIREIAAMFGVSVGHVGAIHCRQKWAWLE